MPYWVVNTDAVELAENACKDVYTCRAKRNVGRHWFVDTGIGYWWIFWISGHGWLIKCSLTLGFVKGVQLPFTIINTLCCKMIHRALGWSDVSCRKWTWDGELVMPAVTTSWCGSGFRAVGIATGPQAAWIGVQFPLGWAVFLLQNVYMGCAAYPAYC